MKFVYPEFLLTFLVLLIPIFIHLYNFRRYKKLYFSSLLFVRHVEQETKSVQRLKHLLILSTRLLAFTAIVFAFAQPYRNASSNSDAGGKPVQIIYIDNSFSMSAKGPSGQLLSEAIESARKVILDAESSTRFLLCTNLLSGEEAIVVGKKEALDRLDKIQVGPMFRTIGTILNWANNILEKEHQSNQRLGTKQFLLYSDFQSNTCDFRLVQPDNKNAYFPIKLHANNTDNLYIDSLWFSTPIHRTGAENELWIRIKNEGKLTQKEVDVQIDINGSKRSIFCSVGASSQTITSLKIAETTPGNKNIQLTLNDQSVFWDDDFFGNYSVDNHLNVLIVNGESASTMVSKVYQLEPYYQVKNISESQLTPTLAEKTDLIVLNGIDELSSSLRGILQTYTAYGKSLALLPGNGFKGETWSLLLNDLELPTFGSLVESGVKINRLNYEDPFFIGVFDGSQKEVSLPSIKKAFRLNDHSSASFYRVIELENGLPLLVRTTGDQQTFVLATVPSEEYGELIKDALFPTILLRIGEMSQRKQALFTTIGQTSYLPIYSSGNGDVPITLQAGRNKFYPQTKNEGTKKFISIFGEAALESLKAGNYSIQEGNKILGAVALNYDRTESKMKFQTLEGVVNGLKEKGITTVEESENDSGGNLTRINVEKPYSYWRLSIILGLIFVFAEMAIIKFWKQNKQTNEITS